MITKLKVELLPLTRELARQFAEMHSVPGERELRQARVNYFLKALQTGTFASPNWSQAVIAREDGGEETLRVDGQHTSHVLATCDDVLFPHDLNATVTTYRIGPGD